MANNDDLNQQYQQDDPNQGQQQQQESPGQDLSAESDAPYGMAGQGQMGDAMSRDVDPNLAGQMGQDPYQQGNVGQDPHQQQGDVNDQEMMGNARQQADSTTDNLEDQTQGRSGGGLGSKLGDLFGRHGDQDNPPDQDDM